MAELLAPAGSMEHVLSAIDAGADAVYLGGKSFNARKFAHNLSDEELAEAVKTAHLFGVKMYVTVNTLAADKELDAMKEYLRYLDSIQADGIIVQDLAAAALARNAAPRLPLHGSTQMTVADLDGVRFLERLGFTQIVLSRELSLREIRDICSRTGMAVEVFVHGASCVSYSGQCLMSSFLGGRSGNRGSCAQPCRLPYMLMKDGTPAAEKPSCLLSLKDLNALSCIGELIDAGVASFKIEGRMKGTGYVRSVVQAYRQVIDSHGRPERQRRGAMKEAEKLTAESFNRTYQHDFLDGSVGRMTVMQQGSGNQGQYAGRIMSCRGNRAEAVLEKTLAEGDTVRIIHSDGRECIGEVKHVSAVSAGKNKTVLEMKRSGLLTGAVYRLARRQDRRAGGEGLSRRIPVYCHVDADSQGKLRMTIWDEQGHTSEALSEYAVQKADKRPATAEWLCGQLDRFGGTPFKLAGATIWDETYMIPASVINELRRRCADGLTGAVLAEYVRPSPAEARKRVQEAVSAEKQKGIALSVRCDTVEAVKAAVRNGADRVIFGGETYCHRAVTERQWKEAAAAAHDGGVSLWAATPRVVVERHRDAVRRELETAVTCGADGVYAGAVSIFSMLEDMKAPVPVYADWSLNIYNSITAGEYIRLGCSGITVSTEATLRQIQHIAAATDCPVEAVVQGRLEMMVTESCVMAAFAGTGRKQCCPAPCASHVFSLEDRKKEQFPVAADQYCRNHILNGRDLDMTPYFGELRRAGVAIVRIEGRGRDLPWIAETVKQYAGLRDGAAPRLCGREDRAVTRGHFFRGIL